MTEKPEQQLDAAAPNGASWIGSGATLCRRRRLAWSIVVLVYLIGVCPMWWPTSDSALYLSLSHSLAQGKGFVYNGQSHNFVTPGLPMVLAGLERAFGPGYWAGNLFTTLCGLGAAAMAYLSIRRISDDSTAFAVAMITVLSYPFYANSHRILTQMPFAAIFWLMVYACLRWRAGGWLWLAAVGFLSILSIVVRAPGLLLVGPLGVGLFFNGDRSGGGRRLRWCGVAMLGPMFIITGAMLGGAWIATGRMPGYLSYGLGVLGGGGFAQRTAETIEAASLIPDVITRLFVGQRGLVPLGVLGAGVIVAGMAHLWRTGQRWIPVFALLAMGGYLLMGPDTFGTRYFLTLMPIYAYALLQGLCMCVRWIRIRRKLPSTRATYLRAIAVFTLICVACHAPKIMRNAFYYSYVGWVNPDDYYNTTRAKKYRDLIDIAAVLNQPAHRPERVGGPKDGERVIHHLSGRIVESYTKKKQEIRLESEADSIIRFVQSHPEIRYFVFDIRRRGKPETAPFFDRFDPWLEKLEADGSMEPLYKEGKYYAAYRRGDSNTPTSRPSDQ